MPTRLPRRAWNALPAAAPAGGVACRTLLAAACLGGASLLPVHAAEPAGNATPETVMPVVKVKAAAPDATTEGSGAYTTSASQAATRLTLSPRETPQSVSVITRSQLDDFGLRSVNDALAASTGVTVERVESDRTYFTARGFDVLNFQLDGLGLPFATGDQLGDIDTAVFDRVEVLRGANGLLSSTGNPSATINFVRKRPTPQAQASAALTLGSWNQRRVDADLSGPLNPEGSVRARLVAATQKGDSYLDRYALEKNLFYGVVEIDVAPEMRFTVGHLQQHNLPNSPLWGALTLLDANGNRLAYDRSANTAADWSYWNTEDVQTFAELNRDLGQGWNAKAVLTRRELGSDGEMLYIYDGLDSTGAQAFYSYPSKYGHREVQSLFDLYATGPFTLGGRRHELVVGLNAARSRNALRSIYADVGVPLTLEQVLAGSFPHPDFGTTVGAQADFVDERRTLYASARANLADDLKLIGGLNLTQVRSDGVQYGEVHHYDVSKATPYLGLVKDLDAQHSLYANYARIFNPQYKLDIHNATLPPVQGSNVELGAKAEWLRRKLQGSVALFRTEQNNTAEFDQYTATFESRYKPIDARSTGIELELVGSLAPNWQLTAGYTQLRLTGSDGQDVRRFVPRKTLRASTTFKPAALPGLSLGAQARWQDDIRSDLLITPVNVQQPAYAVLDLMARYEVNPRLSVSANLNNLTDETYLTSLQWAQSFYGPPRHGSVTLNWTF